MQLRIMYLYLGLSFWVVLGPVTANALEVDEVSPPRVIVEGALITTLDHEQITLPDTPETAGNTHVNTDDSHLELLIDKPLHFAGVVGGMGLNLQLAEEGIIPRLHGFLSARTFRLSLGQMALPNTGERFPTVRDGDLRTYTHIPNGALGLSGEGAQQYGDVLALDLHYRPAYLRFSFFGAERAQTVLDSASGEYMPDPDARANSGGAAITYEVPKGMRYEHWLRRLTLMGDAQSLLRSDGTRALQRAELFAGVMGLNDNPEYPLELTISALRNKGLGDASATTEDALSREASFSTVVGLGFSDRTYLQTRWRVGLTVARKTYGNLSDASQVSVVPAWFQRIGNGVDLVAQVNQTTYSRGLAAITGREREMVMQVGLTVELDAGYNTTIVEPDSILENQ